MKVAVIGAGKMGRNVLRHLLAYPEPLEIFAVDPSPEALRQAVSEVGGKPAGFGEVLEDPEIRLVFVTTANHAHKEVALAALNAGKAVMCEKPIATTLDDAREVVERAETLGAFLQIGFELRYSRLYTSVKQWIDDGLLGEVRHTLCNYVCSEFYGKDSWRIRLAEGGSMFGEKLSHYVDLPRWWVNRPVREVYASASPNIVPYYEIRDNYETTLRFEGGAVSHLSFLMPFATTGKGDPLMDLLDYQKEEGYELRYRVMGTRGGVETNVFRRTLCRWEYRTEGAGFVSRMVERHQWPAEDDHFWFHNTTDQTHDIVRRVAAGLPPSVPARDAFETMRLCDAADRSADQGCPIRIDAGRAVALG